MGFEVWITIVLIASGLSGWVGYAIARKDAPRRSEVDAMAAKLDEARQQAESVQANVSEHFEQSALLFGKLAADYRQFLDHFESSAQNLGLSEARARELIEQGFEPLLTHEQEDLVVEEVAETTEPDQPVPGGDDQPEAELTTTAADEPPGAGIGEVTVELPDETVAAGDDAGQKIENTDSKDSERQRA